MTLRLPHALLIAAFSFGGNTYGQSSIDDSHVQRIRKAENLMSKEAKARIKAVRSTDTVWCGYQDSQGVLWFGSNDGVYRYAEGSFSNLSTADGLSNNRVFSIIEDKVGDLWFGTENGLCRYDRKTVVHIPIPWSDISGPQIDRVYPINNPNQVMCLLQDKNGAIWLGTNGAGACRFDGETFTNYLADRGRNSNGDAQPNVITSILEDRSGAIWFTSISHAGLSRFDGKLFQHYSMKDGLSDDMIRASMQGKDGKIWFGTHGKHAASGKRDGGLDVFDGETFAQLTSEQGLFSGFVISLYEDKSGQIWFGTGTGVLCVYDGTKMAPFTANGGREYAGVQFITEDSSGKVWFGGNQGGL